MSTTADLPATARIMGRPNGNGPYVGGQDAGGKEEQISWAVDWDDRFDFEEAVIGYSVSIPYGLTTITRKIPMQSPYTPTLYAVAFRFKGQGKENTSAIRPYNTLIYTVTFGLLPYGTGGDSPYQSIQAQGGNRSITRPGLKYVFTNGEVIDHGVAITHPGVSYLFTLYQVPDLVAFDMMMLTLLPTPVNNASLSIAGRTFPTGTVCLESYSSTSNRSALGVMENTAQVVLNWSALPWNKLARSDGVLDTTTPAFYQTGNLSTLVY